MKKNLFKKHNCPWCGNEVRRHTLKSRDLRKHVIRCSVCGNLLRVIPSAISIVFIVASVCLGLLSIYVNKLFWLPTVLMFILLIWSDQYTYYDKYKE